ncbi:MAG: methylamine utilization protein MauJ [Verrucomicrobiales bacterium]
MPISIDSGVIDETWIIAYDGREVQVEASKRRFYHTLVTRDRTGFGGNHPFDVFFRVLNELVWFAGIQVDDLNGSHGEYCANLNFRASDDSYLIKLEGFRQQVTTEEQHLALGFFREGLSSGSAFYQFICYSKILEIPFKAGKTKGAWIEQAISGLSGELAVTARDCKIAMLGGKSLGIWLQKDGRNALSHANVRAGKAVRDPNCFKDWDEIKWGNTVMRELAEKTIVEKLHIPGR